MIRETAEELRSGLFQRLSSSIDVDFTHTSKCKNAEEIVKDASYTVGNVLLIGCSELAEDVVTKRDGALRETEWWRFFLRRRKTSECAGKRDILRKISSV